MTISPNVHGLSFAASSRGPRLVSPGQTCVCGWRLVRSRAVLASVRPASSPKKFTRSDQADLLPPEVPGQAVQFKHEVTNIVPTTSRLQKHSLGGTMLVTSLQVFVRFFLGVRGFT
jgi:hypothetical protein